MCVCVCVRACVRARACTECQIRSPNSEINRPIKFASCCQWPRSLRRVSATTRLVGLWVRIPPEVWIAASCECSVLSGRCIFDGPITRPQESYRLWYVWMWSWSVDMEDALAPKKKLSFKFPLNLVFKTSVKICRQIQDVVKIWQNYRALHLKT